MSDSHTVTQPLKHATAEPPRLDNLSHILHFRVILRHSAIRQGSACWFPIMLEDYFPPTCINRPHQDNLSHILHFWGTLEHFLRDSCCNRADIPVLLNTFSEKLPRTYTTRLLILPLLNTLGGKAGMRVRRFSRSDGLSDTPSGCSGRPAFSSSRCFYLARSAGRVFPFFLCCTFSLACSAASITVFSEMPFSRHPSSIPSRYTGDGTDSWLLYGSLMV